MTPSVDCKSIPKKDTIFAWGHDNSLLTRIQTNQTGINENTWVPTQTKIRKGNLGIIS